MSTLHTFLRSHGCAQLPEIAGNSRILAKLALIWTFLAREKEFEAITWYVSGNWGALSVLEPMSALCTFLRSNGCAQLLEIAGNSRILAKLALRWTFLAREKEFEAKTWHVSGKREKERERKKERERVRERVRERDRERERERERERR